MCGITGAFAFSESGKDVFNRLQASVDTLNRRGPDHSGIYIRGSAALGHRRLSIIDLSDAASQPFTDEGGRYTIVFNGEIFNYRELRKELEDAGETFKTESDTEVLLRLYTRLGDDCLQKLNGFFAFAVYDVELDTLFLARDRMGIKPLLYYIDREVFCFGSEMKALLKFGRGRSLDPTAIQLYFSLMYIPADKTILQGYYKLPPGHYLKISPGMPRAVPRRYYQIPVPGEKLYSDISYEDACKKLRILIDESVQRRLVSDVPLGAFLSGGLDSSVIVASASSMVKGLNTFSIGYADEPFFDETAYAKIVATKFGTEHTVFSLSNEDFYEQMDSMLGYIDEPFADSSALAVNILSSRVKKHVTVALSGDGGDEIFGGYNKHRALLRARESKHLTPFINFVSPVLSVLPKSRNGFISNKIRQIDKFANGLNLVERERYWSWATFFDEKFISNLLNNGKLTEDFQKTKNKYLDYLNPAYDFNSVLRTDMDLVLPNDMLTKVDLMSMHHSLEVRVPLLDYTVVDFAFTLPSTFKIDSQRQKKILQDAYSDVLPDEILKRKKQGFEVPLLKWFNGPLRDKIRNEYLNQDFLKEQGIIDPDTAEAIIKKAASGNPGESAYALWALIVFQHWYKSYYETAYA